MNDLRASDVKVWGLCPLSQMWRKPKAKLQIPTPDIWWCPWDKGGAVIYVIGGTHPPIWLAIDINHHQISNGHAFPSPIKCGFVPRHKSFPKTSFSSVCVCVWALQLVLRGRREAICADEGSSRGWREEVPYKADSRQWSWKPQMGPAALVLSSWKRRSCHTTWEWDAKVSDARNTQKSYLSWVFLRCHCFQSWKVSNTFIRFQSHRRKKDTKVIQVLLRWQWLSFGVGALAKFE